MTKYATIIGSGPNGFAAAIELARNGYTVTIREASNIMGGGTRTEEITLPGYLHDICSAIHPLAIASLARAPFGACDSSRSARHLTSASDVARMSCAHICT